MSFSGKSGIISVFLNIVFRAASCILFFTSDVNLNLKGPVRKVVTLPSID